MTAPAGSAAAFREARRGAPIAKASRAASIANMRALIAAGAAGEDLAEGAAAPSAGKSSMRRELAKLGMEPTR